MSIIVGCAGWNLRKEHSSDFPADGTHLERYAARLTGVEINSSFYRSHRRATYQRWAASTPPGFQFAVKLPKQITHANRLVGCDDLVAQFLNEVSGLGEKLGPILVQLPPSLSFDAAVARSFLQDLRSRTDCPIVCEPRHPSWFHPEIETCLDASAIGRVAADPLVVAGADQAGGHRQVSYFRLHGSPRMYYSRYDESYLQRLAEKLLAAHSESKAVWCIFDNTAEGAATENALFLTQLLPRIGAGLCV